MALHTPSGSGVRQKRRRNLFQRYSRLDQVPQNTTFGSNVTHLVQCMKKLFSNRQEANSREEKPVITVERCI